MINHLISSRSSLLLQVFFKEAAGVSKGSSCPNRDKVAKLKRSQLVEIAEKKMVDMNASSIDSAVATLAGTARSMGIDIIDD